ncbi:MAG: hypothetical protein U0840_05110 [Gemmataceae bacterium]
MNELARPLIRAWDYVGNVGGFPGQVFFCVLVIMVVLGGITWIGNRK